MLFRWLFIAWMTFLLVFYTLMVFALFWLVWQVPLWWAGLLALAALMLAFWYSPLRQYKTLSADQLAAEMSGYSLFMTLLVGVIFMVIGALALLPSAAEEGGSVIGISAFMGIVGVAAIVELIRARKNVKRTAVDEASPVHQKKKKSKPKR